uniref:Uncharacterized protein n=1 Tax=Homalodisca liturata TaxID=320908 RepID=A0A1B6K1R0_9HEMI
MWQLHETPNPDYQYAPLPLEIGYVESQPFEDKKVHQTPALPKEENGTEEKEEEGGDEKKDNEEEDPLLEVISIYNNMDERTQLLGPHYTHRDTLFYHKLNFACLTHKTFNLLPHHAVWET